MTEVWLPVVGYENAYEVSDQGQVRSLNRIVARKNGTQQRVRGRILAQCTPKNPGYPQVTLCRNGINYPSPVT